MCTVSTDPTTEILAGRNILVTRPAHQADTLCRLIESEGGVAVRFPVLEITGACDREHCVSQIEQLDHYDIAVFISPNAVEYALELTSACRPETLPGTLKIAAVGNATAARLGQHGYTVDFLPADTFNSEVLLTELTSTSLTGKQIIIFRGDGGRELLGDTLINCGAHVEYCEVYRRVKPDTPLTLPAAESKDEIHLVTVTSGKGVKNLFDLTSELQLPILRNTQFLAGSDRVASVVRTLGGRHEPLLADNPGDLAMFAAIRYWAGSLE